MKTNLTPRTRWTIIIVVVAVALAVLAAWKPWNTPLTPQMVLADAYDATTGVSSFKIAASSTFIQSGNLTGGSTFDARYQAPDRYYAMTNDTGSDGPQEFIVIGEVYYVKNVSLSSAGVRAMITGLSRLLDGGGSLSYLETLTDIQTFPDETMDGVTTHHYKGKLDVEKQIEEMTAAARKMRDENGIGPTDEQLAQQAENMRATIDMSYEVWIGANDWLVRKIIVEEPNHSAVSTLSLFDFNVPNTIEAPVDAAGHPLDGWALADVS